MMMKRKGIFAVIAACMLLLCAVALSACDGGEQNTAVTVTSVTITGKPADNKMDMGTSVTLGYTFAPTDAKEFTVSWSSKVPSVATVTDDGAVNAVAEGSTIITLTVNGTDVSDAFALTVEDNTPLPEVTGIEFTGLASTEGLSRGESLSFGVSNTPAECAPFELNFTVTNNGEDSDVVTITKTVAGYKMDVVNYGSAKVTATVNGKTVSKSFDVTVTGDVDKIAGVETETFERGKVVSENLPAGAGNTANYTLYKGAFFNAGARTNSTTPGELALEDNGLEFTMADISQSPRITFHYNDPLESGKKYIVRIPLTLTAVGTAGNENLKMIYGYRTGGGSTYNNVALVGEDKNSATTASANKRVVFRGKGDTQYLEIRTGANWDGEVFVQPHGGENTAAGLKGTATFRVENIQLIDETEIEYDDEVMTFDDVDPTTTSYSYASGPIHAITSANNADGLVVRDATAAGLEAPSFSTGKTLIMNTKRIYKKGLANSEGENSEAIGHTKLELHKQATVDAAKAYKVSIPAMLYGGTESDVFKFADVEIVIGYQSGDKEVELTRGYFVRLGDKVTFEGIVPAGASFNGVIVIRMFNDKITQKADSAKLTVMFDNIEIREVAA